MKIVFYPYTGKGNLYTDIILQGLRKRKFEIIQISKFFSYYREIDIIHLNWYEDILGFVDFVKKATKLFLFKCLGKKIIWTMHNKEPHENERAYLQKIFTNLLINISDKIIIHSRDSKKILWNKGKKAIDKIAYLPHPEYCNAYGAYKGEIINYTKKKPLNLLFIGFVRPYKNLELLIECVSPFEEQVKLIIAGKPKNQAYAEIIKERASTCKNIELDLTFIENEKLVTYLSNADLVILPYDMDSVLNSGAVILSFSYAKSVICPAIGTINDITDKSAIMNYTFTTFKNHKEILTKTIEKAVILKQASPTIFRDWGVQMKNYVTKYHDTEQMIDKLADLYYDCIT